jgi:hypothetical protein
MKTFITSILVLVATVGFTQDTTKVNYIKVLNLDSTDYNPEGFFKILEDRYAPLGEIEELSCVIGDRYYDVEKICIRFVEFPYRWFCFTPYELENKLEEK